MQTSPNASVVVIGAGRIGRCIARILREHAHYSVTLADVNPQALVAPAEAGFATQVLDDLKAERLAALINSHHAVISACGFRDNPQIAEAALHAGASYFDLTEDVASTRAIRAIAEQARPGQVFVPQCGLAPGFIGILGSALAQRFEQLHTLKLRVGALPEYPSNSLMYNLTWSTEGLINEYCNPCEAIKNGRYVELQPLEGLETFSLDGVHYEAFNTSGGLGTLCDTLKGRVQDLTYKTIRYPGHRALMDVLINDLGLGEPGERRELLQRIFDTAIAVTRQDLVVVFVTATGLLGGQLTQCSEYHRIYHGSCFDPHWSAIQISTAAGLCVVVDLFLGRTLTRTGFVRQEDIPLALFMTNPLARPYRESAHHRRDAAHRRNDHAP